MANKPTKNQNALYHWLNNYFSVVIAASLFFFLLSGYMFIIRPKLASTEEAIRLNMEQQQNIYTLSQQKLVNLGALANLYQKISPADLQKFNSVLPSNYPPEKLFGELEDIVSRGGWLLNSVSLDVGEEAIKSETLPGEGEIDQTLTIGSSDENVGRVNIELTIGSIDYPGFKNLLRMLETNLRLFDVTSVDFMPGENQAMVVLTTYYYKNPS